MMAGGLLVGPVHVLMKQVTEIRTLFVFLLACAVALSTPSLAFAQPTSPHPAKKSREHRDYGKKFSENEIVSAASGFFGTTTAAVAKAVERIFADNGLPDAYIKG